MALIDTHCHLYLPEFEADIAEVVGRAIENRVMGMIVVGIDAETSRKAIHLAERYKEIYVSVGIHPNSRVTDFNEELRQIRELLFHPKVVGIGEIGLDNYWDYVSLTEQKTRLQKQLELASEAGLPVIIHNRNAIEELYPILSKWIEAQSAISQNNKFCTGVLHSFSESVDWARRIVNLGFSIGISGVVTFPKAQKLKEVVMTIPQQFLLLETDAPYLSPQPRRGKRNEPAFLIYTLQEIVNLIGDSMESLANVTTLNAQNLFGID